MAGNYSADDKNLLSSPLHSHHVNYTVLLTFVTVLNLSSESFLETKFRTLVFNEHPHSSPDNRLRGTDYLLDVNSIFISQKQCLYFSLPPGYYSLSPASYKSLG